MQKISSTIMMLLLILWASCTFAQSPNSALTEMAPGSIPINQQSIQDLPADVRQQIPDELEVNSIESADPAQEELSEDLLEQAEQEMAEEDLQDLSEEEADEDAFEDELAEEEQELKAQRSAQRFSRIERQYRTGYASALARDLRQFGYEIFAQTITKPSKLAVPSDDYVLGPGDRMRIRIWGSNIDAEFSGEVDKSGNINVPKIGIVPVSGVEFGQVETVIRKEAEKYIQGINIHVSLIELR